MSKMFCLPSGDENGPVLAQSRCLVADPTGTPLNVRTEPNGRIVGTLDNGVLVTIRDVTSSYGKAWARVSAGNDLAPLGWVFRNYLNCEQAANNKPIPGYAFAYRDEPSHSASTLEDCINSCRAAANCSAYVFFISKKLCRLMTRNDAVLEPNGDAVSGYNNAGTTLPREVSLPSADGGGIGLSKERVRASCRS